MPTETRSTEEMRAWLLGTAAAGMNLLASLAEDEELADIRQTFTQTADAFARRVEGVPLRLLHGAQGQQAPSSRA